MLFIACQSKQPWNWCRQIYSSKDELIFTLSVPPPTTTIYTQTVCVCVCDRYLCFLWLMTTLITAEGVCLSPSVRQLQRTELTLTCVPTCMHTHAKHLDPLTYPRVRQNKNFFFLFSLWEDWIQLRFRVICCDFREQRTFSANLILSQNVKSLALHHLMCWH